jgi:hypothetical protein
LRHAQAGNQNKRFRSVRARDINPPRVLLEPRPGISKPRLGTPETQAGYGPPDKDAALALGFIAMAVRNWVDFIAAESAAASAMPPAWLAAT